VDGVSLTEAVVALAGVVGSAIFVNTLLTKWILRRAEKSEKEARSLRDQRIAELTKSRDSLKETVAQLKVQVSELAELRALVSVLKQRIDKLEAQLAQAEKAMLERDEKIEALEAEMERLSNAKQHLEARVKELEADNTRLAAENGAYLKALEAVGADRATSRDNAQETETQEKQEEVA